MWKLIKYELRSKLSRMIGLTVAVLSIDIFLLFAFKTTYDSLLLINLFIVGILFLFLTLLINGISYFNDLNTNHQSFLNTIPDPLWKTLLAKLNVISIEFVTVLFLHLSIGLLCSLSFVQKNETYLISQYKIANPYILTIGYWLLICLMVFLFYLFINCIIFISIMLIQWALQRYRSAYWVSIVCNGIYFYLLIYFFVQLIFNQNILLRPVVQVGLVFMLMFSFLLLAFIHEFMKNRLEF